MIIALTVCLIAFLLYLLLRRLPFRLYSPVYFLVIFYILVTIGGYLVFGFTNLSSGTFYALDLSNRDLQATFAHLFVVLGAFVAGVLGFLYMSAAGRKAFRSRYAYSRGGAAVTRAKRGKVLLAYLVVTILPLVFIVLGRGAEALLERNTYLTDNLHVFSVLAAPLSLVGVFVAGALFSDSRRYIRWWAVLIFVVYQSVFLAEGTRRFALGPLLFCLGALVFKPRSRFLQAATVVSFLAAPLLMQFPLVIRGLPRQGIVPLFGYLSDDPGFFFSGTWDLTYLQTFALNVLYGFPLTSYVENAGPIDPSLFAVSLNPLPGFMTSWDSVSASLRVTSFVPFNALGELLNQGLLPAIIYFLVAGVVFARIELTIRERISRRGLMVSGLLIGLSFLFVLMSTQYNLRSATRILYYMVAVYAVVFLLGKIAPARRSGRRAARVKAGFD